MNQDYRLLAAKYLRRQAKQLAGQLDGVLAAEDDECVHRARVATRRLRAALKMFADCFRPKLVKTWRKEIRRTTDSLSKARDRDVQIEYLCDVLAKIDSRQCVAGIAAILARWELDRQRLQPKIARAIDRLRAKRVLKSMRRETKRILRRSPKGAPSACASAEAVAQSSRHVLHRMERLLDLQQCLDDRYDRRGHHAMRIALKRLRYSLEISRPLYAGRLEGTVKSIKKMQTLLGDVHDCDVWSEDLDRFAASFARSGRFHRLQPGIEYLQEDRRSRRRQAFGELVEFWAKLNDRRFWEELKAIIKGPQPSAAEDGVS
ncbi:MAG: CHAD domain-containing protein [Pirellulales bacterium]|nr:CHAD domain-containing protein [Pirellulales bacterium]